MIDIFIKNPLLLLFVVASIGYMLGNIKVRGSGLGVAAILFVGLFFGAMDVRLVIPEIILLLGLSIFVYSVGLKSGPAFFMAYKKNGIKDFLFVITMVVSTGFFAALLSILMDVSAAAIAGIYAGSTTNTAALAAVIDLLNQGKASPEVSTALEQTVIGYSYSYPMGVLAGIIAILLLEKWLKIDYQAEKQILRKQYPVNDPLFSKSIRITNADICHTPIRALFKTYGWQVVFGRIFHEGKVKLANWDTQLFVGDQVVVVGTLEEIAATMTVLGEEGDEYLAHDRTEYESRRIFISNADVSGRTIASLNLQQKYEAVITRIRRGDIDMLAHASTILEVGDRVKFIAKKEDLDALSAFFGDSYQESSKINLFTFGLGIGLGLVLGNIEFSLDPQVTFKLGYAGGPLIVGLLLGALRRTGPILWTMPYSANITLQQLGLILLLSAIGVSSGHAFVESLSAEGILFFGIGSLISLFTAISTLWIGYKVAKIPFTLLMGMVANQPAILEFANDRAGNNIPSYGYTMMFPIALVMKILIAQLLVLFLS